MVKKKQLKPSSLQNLADYDTLTAGDIMIQQLKGSIALLIGTIIWGSAFVAQSVGMHYIGPFTFQASRCLLAVVALCVIILIFDRQKKDGKNFLSRFAEPRMWKAGILCGLALFVASSLQQIGLVDTDAGKAGFLTAMYIVMVPLLGLLLGRKPPLTALLSIIPAVTGLYLLSCAGVTQMSQGDLLLLGCALAFAVQITLIDTMAVGLDGLRLNCIQCLTCGVLSLISMVLTEQPELDAIRMSWLPICYAGILSMGVAYSLQIVGQKNLEPTRASLIMSLESVFAALSGWLILQETMTTSELFGCVLVFAAVILSQVPTHEKKEKDR